MNALLCNNSVSFENVGFDGVRVIVAVSDKSAEKSRVVFDGRVSVPLFAGAALVLAPFVLLLLCLGLLAWPLSLLRRHKKEMSAEDARAYFASGKGYINNLSEESKRKLLAPSDDNPLGL